MGFSTFLLFFYNKTRVRVCYEAYKKIKKSLLKYGHTRTQAFVIPCLISLKVFVASTILFIWFSFLNILVMFLSISTNLGMHFLKKFTFIMNVCTSFFLLGFSTFRIALTISGSILIPSSEMIFLSHFTYFNAKLYFMGFNDMPYFSCILEKNSPSSWYVPYQI